MDRKIIDDNEKTEWKLTQAPSSIEKQKEKTQRRKTLTRLRECASGETARARSRLKTNGVSDCSEDTDKTESQEKINESIEKGVSQAKEKSIRKENSIDLSQSSLTRPEKRERGETLTSKRMNKFGHRNTNSSARFDNLVKTRDETGPKKHKASGVADKNTETKTMGVEIADLSEIPENSAGTRKIQTQDNRKYPGSAEEKTVAETKSEPSSSFSDGVDDIDALKDTFLAFSSTDESAQEDIIEQPSKKQKQGSPEMDGADSRAVEHSQTDLSEDISSTLFQTYSDLGSESNKSYDQEDLVKLLKSWNTPMEIITLFTENQIPLSCLRLMSVEQLRLTLFKDISLVKYQNTFFENFEKWIAEGDFKLPANIPNEQTTQIVDGLPAGTTIKSILKKTTEGQELLKVFESKKVQTTNRRKLASLILEDGVRNSYGKPVEVREQLANMIAKEFECEKNNTNLYYSYGSSGYTGLIYHKFKNYFSSLKKKDASFTSLTPVKTKNKKLKESKVRTFHSNEEDRYEERQSDNTTISNELQKLKSIERQLDKEEILDLWKRTTTERAQTYIHSNMSIYNVFSNMVYLGTEHIDRMLEIDYNFLFDANCSTVLDKWRLYEKKMTILLGSILTPGIVRDYLIKLGLWSSQEIQCPELKAEEMKLFLILVSLCKIRIFMVQENDEKPRRIAITSVVPSFIQFHSTTENCKKTISSRKEGDEMDCCIHVVGSIMNMEKIIVAFGNLTYEVTGILKAIHTVILFCSVFSIPYPNRSATLWKFIRRYFYDFHGESVSNATLAFITDLNSATNESLQLELPTQT